MDISAGGGVSSDGVRVDTINHPVLVIGLGGTGIDALLRVKREVGRRFKLPDNPITKQKKQKPDNIEYLALETNEHDKKKYRGTTLDPLAEMLVLSNAGIGSILNNRSTMPDYIKSWLSPEITITDGTKGASGNRQAGRLLLFEKINTVIDAIDNKIRSLRTEKENKLLVYMLSGLSGGTGGGMFLDIAYIIRGLMERDYGSKGVDKVEIMGYLFTPDVNMACAGLNVHTEEYIQRNGYAALKELDYWMNIEERQGERFCQKYGTRLDVASPLAPFNLCHLVGASNIDGVFIRDAYDYCMNVTAENIVNFLALEEKESGQEFAIQDYHSNLLANIATMKTTLPPGMPQGANFCYNIIGASAAVLPTAGINAYLACGMFRQVAGMFDARPTDHGLAQFAQAARLDINAMGEELMRQLPPIKLDYAHTDYFSYMNVIKTSRVDIDEKLTQQLNAAKGELGDMRAFAAKIMDGVKAELRASFINPKEGPIYATNLIYSETYPCLLARIETCKQHLQEKISKTSQDIHAAELAAADRLAEAKRGIFITKNARKNAYIEAKVRLYQLRLQGDCYAAMVEAYKEIAKALEAENDKVYAPYAQILEELRKTVSQNETALDAPMLDGQKNYHWDVITVADIAPEIDKIMENTGVELLTRELAKFMLDETERFLSESRMDITGAVSDFIYNQFSGVLSLTMAEMLETRYGSELSVERIIEGEIAPRLFRDAKPVFHLDNASGVFNFPSYGMVSLPQNSPEVQRGVAAYQRQNLSNLRFNIRKSSITDRIFWLNSQNGIPLFAYSPIKVYEELYERTILTKEGVGRHLVMTAQESWVNLPSPIPEVLWGDTYRNPRQKAANDNARKLFAQGLEAGTVWEQNDRWHIIKTAEAQSFPPDATACRATLEEMQANLTRQPEYVTIMGAATAAEACEAFIRSPNLIRLLTAENAKHEKIRNTKAALQNKLADGNREKGQLEGFLKALVCEAIVKRGALYIFEKELQDDPWPPFVNLIDQADYPEFAMFEVYKCLPETRRKIVDQKAIEAVLPEEKLLINLKKWQGKIAIRKGQLDEDMPQGAAGQQMYLFYKNALVRLNAQVAAVVG